MTNQNIHSVVVKHLGAGEGWIAHCLCGYRSLSGSLDYASNEAKFHAYETRRPDTYIIPVYEQEPFTWSEQKRLLGDFHD